MLSRGAGEKQVLDMLRCALNDRRSAKLVLARAKKILKKEGRGSSNSNDIAPDPFREAINKWRDGRRPILNCIQEAGFDPKTYNKMLTAKDEIDIFKRKRVQDLLDAGIPNEFVEMDYPPELLEAKTLTYRERLGLQSAAKTIYLGLMEGMSKEEVSIRLAFSLDLNLDCVRRLVDLVSLHVRPDLQFKKNPVMRNKMRMALALGVPLLLLPFAKVPAKAFNEEILLVLAVVAFLSYPLIRRHLTRKAINKRRTDAADGLVAMAGYEREPVLYLRSHVVDGTGEDSDSYLGHLSNATQMKTIEERSTAVLETHGPVVALEGPGEGIPNLGAARVRLSDVEKVGWQDLVLGLIARASLVVVRFQPTWGTEWEVSQLMRLCPPYQIVFILSTPDEEEWVRNRNWLELRALLADRVSGDLPERLDPTDFCIGFDSNLDFRIFGGSSGVFWKNSPFLDALVDAAAFGNPMFDKFKARKAAIVEI